MDREPSSVSTVACIDTIIVSQRRTEIGGFNMLLPAAAPNLDEWEYFRFSGHLEIELRPQEEMENIFEIVVIVRA